MLRFLFTWVLAFAGVAAAMWILISYTGPMKKWLAMLVALICMSPFFLWKMLFPPAFDLTCFSKTVDYDTGNGIRHCSRPCFRPVVSLQRLVVVVILYDCKVGLACRWTSR